jgi:hypothetical protein
MRSSSGSELKQLDKSPYKLQSFMFAGTLGNVMNAAEQLGFNHHNESMQLMPKHQQETYGQLGVLMCYTSFAGGDSIPCRLP